MLSSRAILIAGVALLTACSDSFVPNYNDPTLDPVVRSAAQLQGQASGLLSGDRENHAFQILILETMGRNAYRIDPADPRYINNPLSQFQPSAFIANFLWNSHYRTVRSAQVLVRGIDASNFSDADKAATRGFARTMQALQYQRLIEMKDTLGIPINLGTGALDPIRCKPAVLAYISALLDSADADLAAGGAAFPFALSRGFSDFGTFDTPATFRQFNRGLKAKNEMYRGFADFARNGTIDAAALNLALAALDASYPTTAAFRNGVYHVYSSASGDLLNNNFDLSVYRANPKVLNQADAGDLRLAKLQQDPSFLKGVSGVSSDIIFTHISGPTTPLPLLINEELLLVRAQVLWGLNRDAEALTASNRVRGTAGGLPDRALGDFATRLDLMREILKQKRYSLLFESGARLIDYRMLGLFNELGPEYTPPGGSPVMGPTVIPYSEAESDARNGDLTCS
jgi:hypothetical protein